MTICLKFLRCDGDKLENASDYKWLTFGWGKFSGERHSGNSASVGLSTCIYFSYFGYFHYNDRKCIFKIIKPYIEKKQERHTAIGQKT